MNPKLHFQSDILLQVYGGLILAGWLADACPSAFSLSLSSRGENKIEIRTGGENKIEMFVDRDNDREMAYNH